MGRLLSDDDGHEATELECPKPKERGPHGSEFPVVVKPPAPLEDLDVAEGEKVASNFDMDSESRRRGPYSGSGRG